MCVLPQRGSVGSAGTGEPWSGRESPATEYPQELLKAPTYSVKVLIELTPPLRAPIVLNVVKDSTVLQVTR